MLMRLAPAYYGFRLYAHPRINALYAGGNVVGVLWMMEESISRFPLPLMGKKGIIVTDEENVAFAVPIAGFAGLQ